MKKTITRIKQLTLALTLCFPATESISQTLVKDIRTGPSHANPNSLFEVNGSKYFLAQDGGNNLVFLNWKIIVPQR